MKTAVLLTGHLRTWNLCKDIHVAGLMELYGPDVDWFVVVWNSNTATADQLKNFFAEKQLNLVHLSFIDHSVNHIATTLSSWPRSEWPASDSIFGPSCLRRIASRIKRIREFQHNIQYDRVIYARPDVVYFYHPDAPSLVKLVQNNPDEFALKISGDFNELSYGLMSPTTNDIMPVTGRLSSDIYGFMYLDINKYSQDLSKIQLRGGETHAYTSMYLKNHLITIDSRMLHACSQSYVEPIVIRPSSDQDYFLKNERYKNWDRTQISAAGHDKIWGLSHNEHEDTWEKRKEHIKKLGIDPRDYMMGE